MTRVPCRPLPSRSAAEVCGFSGARVDPFLPGALPNVGRPVSVFLIRPRGVNPVRLDNLMIDLHWGAPRELSVRGLLSRPAPYRPPLLHEKQAGPPSLYGLAFFPGMRRPR